MVIAIGLAFMPKRSHAQSALKKTNTYYATEFKNFNSFFEKHLDKLADCLDTTFQNNSNYVHRNLERKLNDDCERSTNERVQSLKLIQSLSTEILGKSTRQWY